MGLLRSLAMLVLQLWLLESLQVGGQNATITNFDSASALDVLLQDHAYRALKHPKTGIPYSGSVPSNLTGISISALRLRSGSLRRKGVKTYKEFEIPTGVIVSPYVKRLVFVYQNLGNWSIVYYPLPGFTYLAPVLGLLVYDASNLSATNLPELDVEISGNPLLVHFTGVKPAPMGSVPRCVWFNLHGMANFSSLGTGNTCSMKQQGHLSIVVESIAPSPSPTPTTGGGGTPGPSLGPSGRGKKKSSRVGVAVGSVLGGLVLLILLTLLVLWVLKHKQKKRIQRMERAADAGEALRMTSIGDTKAPAATVTRTQPVLEHEYVP